MTFYGGPDSSGVIFKYNPIDSTYINVYEFDSTHGVHPRVDLFLANNGKMYGITTTGGAYSNGVIFSLDTTTNAYTDEYDFHDNTDGNYPYGSLFQASNGMMYGMTNQGGTNNDGIIFNINPVTNVYTIIHNFDRINGLYPQGNLMQASNGLLYGMTSRGGIYDTLNGGDGVIFSLDPSTNIFTKFHDFNGMDGSYPYGSLIQGNDGKFYGLTSGGGQDSYGWGVLFSFDPSNNSLMVLYNFHTQGIYPHGSLIQASDGKLYGLTPEGGTDGYGVVFSYDLYSHIFSVIYNFTSVNSNGTMASLIQANDGNLYGLSAGDEWVGYLYRIDPNTDSFTYLHTFTVNNPLYGYYVRGSLLQGSDGELYGMTYNGGAYNSWYSNDGNGVVFKYDIANDTVIKIKDFKGYDGVYATGDLIEYKQCILSSLSTTANDTICPGDSVNLIASGATSYLWLPGNYITDTITVSPSSTIIYSVIGITDSCRNTKTITVKVQTNPIISPASSTTVCYGDTVILTSSPANTYSWNTGATTQSIIVITSGFFTDTVSYINGSGCSFSSLVDTVIVNPVPPIPIITLSGDTLISSGTTGNLWFRNNDSIAGQVFPFFFPTQNGVYSLEVTNSYGCTSTSTAFYLVDLGISKIKMNNTVFVYPNPFDEQTTLYFNSYNSVHNSFLLIYDLMGREVKRIPVNQNKTIINKEDLAMGMYFYNLITTSPDSGNNSQSEIIANGKLVIQ